MTDQDDADLAALRAPYTEAMTRRREALGAAGLDAATVHPDPVVEFGRWLDRARAALVPLAEAMTLATATPDGVPSARLVFLRGFDARGFVFFTNYASQKGRELAENPHAAAVFHFAELGQQVRVEGRVERVAPEENAAYFARRAPEARLADVASPQSAVIAGREEVERRLRELVAAYPAGDVPIPEWLGGYRLVPDRIEFWQQRPNRLHDRLRFVREGGGWRIERLAP